MRLCSVLFVVLISAGLFLAPAAANDLTTCQTGPAADAAIRACSRLIASGKFKGNGLANLYANRGRFYFFRSDFDRALSDDDEAIRLHPKYFGFYVNRGVVWISKGDYDRALADFDQAIALNRKWGPLWSNRGYVLILKEEFDRAITDLNEAVRLAPKYAQTFANRGLAWLKKGDLDRALSDFDNVLSLDPKFASGYDGRGLVWRAKGEFDRAIAEYSAAIAAEPARATAYTNRGLAYEAKGDIERARADFAKSMALPRVQYRGKTGNVAIVRDYERDQKIARARLAVLSALPAEPARPVVSSTPSVAPARPVVPSPASAEPARPAVLSTSPAEPPRPSAVGRRVALVIGNGAYVSVPSLRNPPNDARALAGSLRGMGFEVSEGIDLDHTAMQRTISEFLHDAATARIALVFYAGHGVQINGNNYLLPIDIRVEGSFDSGASMINVDTILAALDDRIRSNIVILDACRDNPLTAQRAGGTAASRSVFAPGLAQAAEPEKGAIAGAGTLIAFATAPGQVALDGDGPNSPFSTALARHISTPGLEVQQMMTRVRAEVVAATHNKQVPWANSSLIGEVYLAR